MRGIPSHQRIPCALSGHSSSLQRNEFPYRLPLPVFSGMRQIPAFQSSSPDPVSMQKVPALQKNHPLLTVCAILSHPPDHLLYRSMSRWTGGSDFLHSSAGFAVFHCKDSILLLLSSRLMRHDIRNSAEAPDDSSDTAGFRSRAPVSLPISGISPDQTHLL